MMSNIIDIINKKLDGNFPIGVWVPYYKSDLTLEYLKEIKDSGVNFIPSLSVDKEEIDLISKSGLKIIANDDRISYANILGITNVGEWAKEYVNNKDIFGLFIWDEPSPLMMNFCGTINTELQKQHPNTFGFINLHPNYSDKELQRNGLTYEEYLEYYVNTCNPKIICYDNYPFYKDGFHGEDYFDNLDKICRCASKHNLDFWTFIQSSAFLTNSIPTCGEMNFHVSSSIAYGAKGILYFTYKEVTHEKGFTYGLIDREGKKTDLYFYAQNINRKINSIGKKLLSLKHLGVAFLCDRYKKFSTIECDLKSDNSNLLVGFFIGEQQKEYIYVVNMDMENSIQSIIEYKGRKIVLNINAGCGELFCI